MSNYIFTQLNFVRNNTLQLVSTLDERKSEILLEGLSNHVKWNLGHIYFVQEKFAFHFLGEEMLLPPGFAELYAPGTRPGSEPADGFALAEILDLLDGQMTRIEAALSARLKEEVKQPYTTSKGLRLSRVDEFLSFCLYHEGMHFEKIKTILRLIELEDSRI
ncbi:MULTISPECIES: DinB family protein [Paenibacillus]|uniref:DinB family protein n=1 Tax=Paenibacillus TaxID=44249 RepID=UPI002FE31406